MTKNDEGSKTCQFGQEKVKGFQRQSNWMGKGDGGPKRGEGSPKIRGIIREVKLVGN